MVKPSHAHHAISIPFGAIIGVIGGMKYVSSEVENLLESSETAEQCMELLQSVLSIIP